MTPDAAADDAERYASRVLLVDDQLMVCEAIRRSLATEPDLHVEYCTDPAAAIEAARRMQPTVILQDLVMPGIDGLDLVARYRREADLAPVPVIVLSAREDAATKSEAFRLGADDYLVKLPDRIELVARIRYHTRAYLYHRQRDAALAALRRSQAELTEANRELERLTRIDGLTGLSNRRYFDEHAASEWRRAARNGTAVGILMIDVDHFKRFNDTYGHVAGDDVLRKVAQVIGTGTTRATDFAARYGGEEFVVLLAETDARGAVAVAERLVEGTRALGIANGTGHVTISVGVGVATATATTDGGYGTLLGTADAALYEAKAGGRDRYVFAGSVAAPISPPGT